MSKKRVYEFAKEKGHSSREIIELAAGLGIEYGSHMNSMSEEEVSKLTAALEGDQKEAPFDQKQSGQEAGAKEKQATDKQGQKEAAPQKEEKKKESNDHQKQANSNQKQNNKNNNKNRNRNRRGMGTHGGVKGTGQNKKQGQKQNQNQKQETKSAPAKDPKNQVLEYTEGMTIAEIADQLNRDSADLVKRLFLMGVVANQNQSLDKDTIEILAADLGIEAEEKIVIDETDFSTYINAERDEENLVGRPPVVTIMGHVDHGKTTLLDKLRDARVTEGEAGGITQHIGAYQLVHDGQTITFLDTPGHAAFTTMRARGADITDIAIIVVAADDGVMPQTVEAINHAKAAEVPIIIAVNKIDKPTANPDRVKQELTEHGIIPEEWGGDNIFVEISALHSLNLEELLEMIILVAEIQELKADPTGRPIGTVIEARLDKSRGPVATVLIQEGTLKVGDPIVVGNTHGRVRTMTADTGEAIEEAGPSRPIEITGLNETPEAGDHLVAFEEEKKARAIGEERAQQQLLEDRQSSRPVTLENLFDTLQDGELKEVNLIVKADVRGSVEALASSLEKIEVDGVRVNIIHTGVGAINESDVTLAAASQAIIIGFSVRPMGATAEFAEREGVTIRTYNVIYDAIDDVESAMKGLLDPEFEEQVIGHLTVRETYKVSKIGTIAGCYVNRGKITRQSNVRLIRNGVVVYEGALASLRRYQDDVREVTNGFECGLMIEDFNDIKVDDEIEAYEMVEVDPV